MGQRVVITCDFCGKEVLDAPKDGYVLKGLYFDKLAEKYFISNTDEERRLPLKHYRNKYICSHCLKKLEEVIYHG